MTIVVIVLLGISWVVQGVVADWYLLNERLKVGWPMWGTIFLAVLLGPITWVAVIVSTYREEKREGLSDTR